MLELSNAVVGQAASKGLRVQRIIFSDQEQWDGRSLLVEDKPCQIVRTHYCISNPRSPEAVSIPLYLPRTDWPDFVIYVVRRTTETGPLEYYVLPRGVLSKDTALCPSTLDKYRDAWGLLKETLSPDLVERRFADLNWQLRNAIAAAKQASLEVCLIRLRHKRPWPLFAQTRLIIADRRCTLHSLSRINPDPNRSEHDYVALRKPKRDWGEFQLYVLPGSKEPVVYVIPSESIKTDTFVSLKNERLAVYRNNWSLLAQSVAETNEIEWRPKAPRESIVWRTKAPKPPKEPPIAIRKAINEAEKQGLRVERPHLATQYQLYISTKRCQIFQTKPIVSVVAEKVRTYVPLNLPRLDWAEFLIFFVRADAAATSGDFYIVPRTRLPKRTVVSPTSSWLREYAGAWHLLKPC